MALNLMYITNNPRIAEIAESSGVDWIFIDLEINGKEERQGHLDTVISRHHIEDVKIVKSVLENSKLLVRVNPIYEGSINEINRVIDDGADIVMLPFFKSKDEVETFVRYVGNRSKTILLLETPEAVDNIDDILSVDGIDYIHIGLNDLHLGYNMKFMFELLADGTVEKLCNKIKSVGIPYGFGGIAQLGKGDLPAEKIITEHYRLGSSMVILSRSFCNEKQIRELNDTRELFLSGVKEIRDFENDIINKPLRYYEKNKEEVIKKVCDIVSNSKQF
jgi:2-keto-3-deoxy-L-rhamnonate aldolase RhmA